MILHTEILRLPRIKDRVKIEIVTFNMKPCWIAYRESAIGWDRIPAMTEAEEQRFPKTVGLAAQVVLLRYLSTSGHAKGT
jgi:hypothetical protein